MTRPWVLMAAGACVLLVLAIVSKQFGRTESVDATRSTGQAAAPLRVPGAERPGWIARPDAAGSLAAGSEAASRSRQPRAGESGGPGPAGATASERGLRRSEGGGAATIVRRADRGDGSVVGSTGSDSIQVAAAVPVEANVIEGATPRVPRMGGENVETEARALSNQPPVNVQDKPKDVPADAEGVVLQLSFNKTTQPEKGDTAPVVEQGVTLDSSAGAHFAADSQFVIPDTGNLKGEAGTISFTLQPEWSGDDKDLASLLQLHTNDWANRLQIFKDGSYLRFLFTPDTGIETNPSVDIRNWQSGQPYQITTTWGATPSGDHVASLYINGQLASQQSYDGQLDIPPGTPLYIGSDHQGGQPGARGVMSDFTVYNTVRTPEQIAAAAGTMH